MVLVGHKRERVLGRVGCAVVAAARDFVFCGLSTYVERESESLSYVLELLHYDLYLEVGLLC